MSSLWDRFWSKVDASGDCWEWTGHVGQNGYGQIRAGGKAVGAHRASWELLVGPIPAGLHMDHLCRNRRCVNPDHLEPVTSGENTRRAGRHGVAAQHAAKTACPRGHAYDMQDNKGRRRCRTCLRVQCRENQRRYRARNR